MLSLTTSGLTDLGEVEGAGTSGEKCVRELGSLREPISTTADSVRKPVLLGMENGGTENGGTENGY